MGADIRLFILFCMVLGLRPSHGCCWETFYICAFGGLVGNLHVTAKTYFFAPLPTSTKILLPTHLTALRRSAVPRRSREAPLPGGLRSWGRPKMERVSQRSTVPYFLGDPVWRDIDLEGVRPYIKSAMIWVLIYVYMYMYMGVAQN